MKFFTIGHSNKKLKEFIKILKKYEIEVLVDVRRFPTSKFEHFKKENLEKALKKEKIKYIWLGDLLGGYRSEGYENYTKTKEYKKGIEKLIKIKAERIAIMCSERFWFRCHRRFISKTLKELGFKVYHIVDEKTYEQM